MCVCSGQRSWGGVNDPHRLYKEVQEAWAPPQPLLLPAAFEQPSSMKRCKFHVCLDLKRRYALSAGNGGAVRQHCRRMSAGAAAAAAIGPPGQHPRPPHTHHAPRRPHLLPGHSCGLPHPWGQAGTAAHPCWRRCAWYARLRLCAAAGAGSLCCRRCKLSGVLVTQRLCAAAGARPLCCW